ncbi:MAG TPA: anthranilate phosphoribosyltransferase [Actinomycetota bacterium]|nr:anthranilate phosphoribosyltransferase [Actinomycetota bacterium]
MPLTASEPDPDLWPRVLSHLVAGGSLDRDTTAEAIRAIMREAATPAQVAGFLMALRAKGETADELEGASAVALEMANPVSAPEGLALVDTCGTGGDRSGTFNISTLGAIVVAGAGVPVAKHGNRAASSRCGSADLLEALGVRIDLDADGVERCLAEAGIGFMFAPVFHPAAAYAAGIRRELRVPTIFNFLGPLTNPARPAAQVVGVSDPRMLPLLAEVLARRGIRAKVVRGSDGLDELTTTGPSTVLEVADGTVAPGSVDPADLGLASAAPEQLVGGDVQTNVAIARRVLEGAPGPERDVVLLNAAAVLEVAGRAADLAEGVALAAASVDSGSAARALERWVAVSATR